MVAISQIRQSNAQIKNLPSGQVALFIGATSGIGQSTLLQFAQHTIKPRIYIMGRSATAAAPLLAELKERNAEGSYEFIEKDASLLRDIDAVCAIVKSKETKLDFLFLSVGFMSFDGRKDTPEALDPTMSTRYYSRLRATHNLIPLLNASPSPHVVSILAGGQESASLNTSDLDLRDPKNYSFISASIHSATMGTLTFEHLATENPKISFVHTFPGIVSTPLLTRGSSGLVGFLMRWVLVPVVNTFFAMGVEEAGQRVLFYATSARYSVAEEGVVALEGGLEKARTSPRGVFLVDAKGEGVDNDKVLKEFHNKGVDEVVWKHFVEVCDAVAASGSAA